MLLFQVPGHPSSRAVSDAVGRWQKPKPEISFLFAALNTVLLRKEDYRP